MPHRNRAAWMIRLTIGLIAALCVHHAVMAADAHADNPAAAHAMAPHAVMHTGSSPESAEAPHPAGCGVMLDAAARTDPPGHTPLVANLRLPGAPDPDHRCSVQPLPAPPIPPPVQRALFQVYLI